MRLRSRRRVTVAAFLRGGVALLLSFGAASCATRPVPVNEPRPSPGLDRSRWALHWQEEFDGISLDDTKWSYLSGAAGQGAVAARGTVRLDGLGHLLLSTRLRGSLIEGAELSTKGKFAQRYGYFECRLRAPRGDESRLVFRLVEAAGASSRDVGASKTLAVIAELKVPSRGLAFQAWKASGAASVSVSASDLSDRYHVYGLEWTETGYAFYVDGMPTLVRRRSALDGPAYLEIGMEVDKGSASAIARSSGFHDEALIDYLRVYNSLQGEGR